jgi:hypothetical protein
MSGVPASVSLGGMMLSPIASAIINAAFRFKTPDEWVAFAEARLRLAGLVRLCSAVGLDPHKAMNALKEAVGKR